MSEVKHAATWFEIPSTDFNRAREFYGAIFGYELPTYPMGDHEMAFFLCDRDAVGGAVIHGPGRIPSADGTTVYLYAGDDLSTVLDKIEGAGGTVILPKIKVTDEIGHIAMFIDSEGNKVALHSRG